MIAAGREPWKEAFERLKESHWSNQYFEAEDRGSEVPRDKLNQTIGRDGRRAHDLALLWRLTDDKTYADAAVRFLNANSHYTDTTESATWPLDNGKFHLLIEAAELMRDYEGWKAEDQARFKKMLTLPRTVYFCVKNFDPARYGNQGIFAAKALISMGVYLDDEKMYDRAVRYMKGEKHREDDEPYTAGPFISGNFVGENEYRKEWQISVHKGNEPDWGFDEQICHYIQANGQCQESSRDQHHTMFGLHNLVAIAEVAWNQGDDLYSFADSRILLGLEWSYRYNLSKLKSYPGQETAWEPTGFTDKPEEATFENGKYLQYLCRSARWLCLKPTDDRGDIAGSGGTREAALAHYAVRAGLDKTRYTWLERYRDYMIDNHTIENWGIAPNWFYEWTGWGTLTKRRTAWMAGDPVTWRGEERISGAHKVPGSAVKWTNCDYYPGDGNGHTFKRSKTEKEGSSKKETLHRGDWNAFTITCANEGDYELVVYYKTRKLAKLAASIDKSKPALAVLHPSKSKYSKASFGKVHVPVGASVLRIAVADDAPGLEIAGFQFPEGK